MLSSTGECVALRRRGTFRPGPVLGPVLAQRKPVTTTLRVESGVPEMTPDEYIETVLARHELKPGLFSYFAKSIIVPELEKWANGNANRIVYTGSMAKGTAVSGATDLDIFISLSPGTPHTLEQIYERLYRWSEAASWLPRRQNVSIGLNYLGVKIDLVPGKLQEGWKYYHSLWRHKAKDAGRAGDPHRQGRRIRPNERNPRHQDLAEESRTRFPVLRPRARRDEGALRLQLEPREQRAAGARLDRRQSRDRCVRGPGEHGEHSLERSHRYREEGRCGAGEEVIRRDELAIHDLVNEWRKKRRRANLRTV